MSYSNRTSIFDGSGKALALAAAFAVVGAHALEKAGHTNQVGRIVTPIIDTVADAAIYGWRSFPELSKLRDRTFPNSDGPVWKSAP